MYKGHNNNILYYDNKLHIQPIKLIYLLRATRLLNNFLVLLNIKAHNFLEHQVIYDTNLLLVKFYLVLCHSYMIPNSQTINRKRKIKWGINTHEDAPIIPHKAEFGWGFSFSWKTWTNHTRSPKEVVKRDMRI